MNKKKAVNAMKTTTTLYDILQSELIMQGFDEFENNGRLTAFDDDFAFMKKMQRFDADIKSIVTDKFFNGFTFSTLVDETFKKMFLHKFMNREIQTQTMEVFSSNVSFFCMANEHYIEELFQNLDDYIRAKTTNTSTQLGNSTTQSRDIFSTLPQDEINISLNDPDLDFADTNHIAKSGTIQDGSSEAESNSFNLDNLLKTNGLIEELFRRIDRECFLQVW